ncbi:hypothetical protein RCI18_08275, partial [Staphylococcus haemolyticus]|nr:hypothetical protein [Staphylococcus haemolyticus]
YQFDGKKAKRIDNFDTKQYIESHDADYKEENMN